MAAQPVRGSLLLASQPAKLNRLAAVALAAFAFNFAHASTPRSHSAKAEFQRANACPSTGARRGPCPGYVIDHIDPLCNGGADSAVNMQWQTIADAKTKDHWERQLCRAKRPPRT